MCLFILFIVLINIIFTYLFWMPLYPAIVHVVHLFIYVLEVVD